MRCQGDSDIVKEEYAEILASQKREKEDEEAESRAAETKRVLEKMQERAKFHVGFDQSTSLAKLEAGSKWAGKHIKVIVKAATYILQPGEEYAGTWHLEGMPHERVVASAIYYYERDPSIIDAGLYLRRKRDYYDFPSQENYKRDVSTHDCQSSLDLLNYI
jgi:hypothetical protein